MVPLLKYVRGEALSQDHWLELFRLLKMPKGTTLEKLTFGNVLEAADLIVTHAEALKVLLFDLPFPRIAHLLKMVLIRGQGIRSIIL